MSCDQHGVVSSDREVSPICRHIQIIPICVSFPLCFSFRPELREPAGGDGWPCRGDFLIRLKPPLEGPGPLWGEGMTAAAWIYGLTRTQKTKQLVEVGEVLKIGRVRASRPPFTFLSPA